MIDFMKAYTTSGAPLFAPGVAQAVERTPQLLVAAREVGVPVIHTNIPCAVAASFGMTSPLAAPPIERQGTGCRSAAADAHSDTNKSGRERLCNIHDGALWH